SFASRLNAPSSMGRFDKKGVPIRSFGMSKMRLSHAYSFIHYPGSGNSKDSAALEKPRCQNTRATHA
ncbi:MAG: hypothetical protein ACE5PT_14515, partial [Gemmatimonadales bacterium]